jgi:PPOX class probable F420-dependent enzyme
MDGLPEWAEELLRVARVARLGLLDDDGAPRVLPVTFALARGRVYSAVDDKPKRRPGHVARVRFLRARPRAALTVDRYDDDWRALAWVQLLGTVDVLDDPGARPEALAALVSKYAPYRERPPRGPLLELTVARALHWSAGATVPAMPERLQLLHYDYVPDIVERRGPHRDGHLALIARWQQDGRIVMAGAVGDPPRGGLLVLRVDDPAQVRAFVDEDPYVANGLVSDWRVEPWNVVT